MCDAFLANEFPTFFLLIINYLEIKDNFFKKNI